MRNTFSLFNSIFILVFVLFSQLVKCRVTDLPQVLRGEIPTQYYYNGIKKESVAEGHNIRRLWSWQDVINESVCKQKIRKPIQGNDWSKFSD